MEAAETDIELLPSALYSEPPISLYGLPELTDPLLGQACDLGSLLESH